MRLSFVADLLSRPVLVGYMAGIGVLAIDGQLDNFLGVSTDAEELRPHLGQVAAALPTADWAVVPWPPVSWSCCSCCRGSIHASPNH